MTIRTNLTAGRRGVNSVASCVRTVLAAALISTLCLAASAQAQPKIAILNYACNIEGAQAQLTARVQAVTGAGIFIDPSGFFAGSIPADTNFFYEGQLTSQGGRYS